MEKQKPQNEKILEPKTIISWVILVLFIIGIILIYVFFKKEPAPKPASLEELKKITEEAYNKLENPTPLEELKKITEEASESIENPMSLEELKKITEEANRNLKDPN